MIDERLDMLDRFARTAVRRRWFRGMEHGDIVSTAYVVARAVLERRDPPPDRAFEAWLWGVLRRGVANYWLWRWTYRNRVGFVGDATHLDPRLDIPRDPVEADSIPVADLTDRELSIVHLLARGARPSEVAISIGVSRNSVSKSKAAIRAKAEGRLVPAARRSRRADGTFAPEAAV